MNFSRADGLIAAAPALTPTTLLEHLQEQKPDQHRRALPGPTPELMVRWPTSRVRSASASSPRANGWRSPCGANCFRTCWHHDSLIVVLGSDLACQLPHAFGNGGHGRRCGWY